MSKRSRDAEEDEAGREAAEVAAAPATELSTSSSTAAVAAASTTPPPDSASLRYATLWYYLDATQTTQGPFDHTSMRAWYDAGYIAPTTPCAPSFYGEVPTYFWPVAELYAKAEDGGLGLEHAFCVADEVAARAEAAAAVVSRGPDFLPSEAFDGPRETYVFKADVYGTGYYRDEPPEITVTSDILEAEAAERLAKIKAFKSQAGQDKFDGIGTG